MYKLNLWKFQLSFLIREVQPVDGQTDNGVLILNVVLLFGYVTLKRGLMCPLLTFWEILSWEQEIEIKNF